MSIVGIEVKQSSPKRKLQVKRVEIYKSMQNITLQNDEIHDKFFINKPMYKKISDEDEKYSYITCISKPIPIPKPYK